MVEGPGCTRNGNKSKVCINHKVLDVDKFESSSSSSSSSSHSQLKKNIIGKRLTKVFSLGKELFFTFSGRNEEDTITLRLHFGMNGRLDVIKNDSISSSAKIPSWRKKEKVCLRLTFEVESNKTYCKESTSSTTIDSYYNNNNRKRKYHEIKTILIEARETTVGFIASNVADTKFHRLSSCDVCGPNFNPQDVYTKISSKASSCPSLIISDALLNQDLFPGVGNIIKIESLHKSRIDPRELVRDLIVCDEGRGLQKLNSLIQNCRDFSMNWLKTGSSGKKMVYNQNICGTCQQSEPSTIMIQKLGGNTAPAPARARATSSISNNNNQKGHAYMSRVTFWCSVCQPSSNNNKNNATILSTITSISSSLPTKKNNEKKHITQSHVCPIHGSNSVVLRRVRKKRYQQQEHSTTNNNNNNESRIFFTCQRKGCEFFSWADTRFPRCKCENNKTSVLKMSKTANSGGRWFFCCGKGNIAIGSNSSSRNSENCGFFQWAETKDLLHIQPKLTPLL